jgi:ATP-dependent DNA helicase RecG
MGSSQSGAKSKLRLLRVLRDEAMIETARDEATALIAQDPALSYESELAKALAQLESDTSSEFIDRG